MKKLLFLLLLPVCLKAANPNIWFTSSDTVSVGDTEWLEIKYTYTNVNDTARLYLSNSNGTFCIYKNTFAELNALQKYHTSNSTNPLDSVTRIYFTVPNCGQGPANYIGKNQIPVYVKATSAGIEELEPSLVLDIKYYDLLGRETNPVVGQLVIRVVNNKTEKIIWTNF